MSLTRHRELVWRLSTEVWNAGDLAAINPLLTPDHIHHDPSNPEVLGRESYRPLVRDCRQAFPNLHFTVEQVTGEGDTVVAHFTGRGTHCGEFIGLTPTGRPVAIAGCGIYRISEDRITEGWIYRDALGLVQQLGRVLAPEELDAGVIHHLEAGG